METITLKQFLFAPRAGKFNFPRHSLTCIVKGTFDLRPNGIAAMAEEPLYPTGDEFYPDDEDMTGSMRYENDFAYYKPATDLLLAGHCHAPGGKPAQACKATFRVGQYSSTLAVFGNRFCKGTQGLRTISVPEPFVKMELRYENSFGGPGYDRNPVGLGFIKTEEESGNKTWQLPNIEDPDNRIDYSSKPPEPAGFGPLGRMWKLRYAKMGTYKKDWQNKRWPWLPEDFNWRHFNAAQPGMQVEGYLRGDEKLYFENLHPEHARYESQLPGIRVRCFTNRLIENVPGTTDFKEVAMRLDTLWVDMDAEKLVLVWRGVTEIKDEQYDEIQQVFIMDEPLEQKAATLECCHELFLEELKKREKEWKMEPEELETVDAAASGTVKAVIPASDEGEIVALKVPSPPERKEKSEEIKKPEKLDPVTIKAEAKALMAQAGLDLDTLPPEVRQKTEQQMDKIIARMTEDDPAKVMAMQQQEALEQLDKSLAQVGIDRNNLPTQSNKAQVEQIRFMQEMGMDPAMLEDVAEIKQFWGIFSAVLPKLGINPENLDPLIRGAKKHMDKIRRQIGTSDGENDTVLP